MTTQFSPLAKTGLTFGLVILKIYALAKAISEKAPH